MFRTYIGRINFELIVVLAYFAIIATLSTFPVQEGDFFWHVKTGGWIWEHKSLPTSDPFTFVNKFINQTQHVAGRTQFLLKQYWLGQLALFGIWKAAGEAGMVVLRAVIYTGIIAFIYRWLRQTQSGIIPLAAIFVVGNVLITYPNERPQIFAYLFMVFMLYLLERLIRCEQTARTAHATLLLLVMLLWSNSHGSFILGIIVIMLYGAGHLMTCLLRGATLSLHLLVSLSGAIAITLANPNGFAAFQAVRDVNKTYTNSIAEYASPFRLVIEHHVFHYGFWFLLAVALVVLIFNFRSMAFHHIAVVIALAALSLTAIRYIPFFVMATPLLAIYLPDTRPTGTYRILPFLVLLAWLGTVDLGNALKFRAARTFPKAAIQFINTAKPSGNMFNYVFWGGYLMCYTDLRVFADGRGLAENFTQIHNQVLAGLNWQGPLSYFEINTIFIPGTDQLTNQPYPILLQLLRDNGWALIYQDNEALIFMRNIPQNRDFLERYAISKDRISTHIIGRIEWMHNNDL